MNIKPKAQRIMGSLGLWHWQGGLLIYLEGIDEAGIHQKPKQIPLPLLPRTSHWVVGPVLVKQVHTTHVLVVGEDWLQYLLGLPWSWEQSNYAIRQQ